MRFVIRWIITSLAVAAAVYLVPGISVDGERGWLVVVFMALILGLVNAFVRPLLTLLSCGCIVLTMGLFLVVVNGAAFYLASYMTSNWFNIGFYVDGIWPAVWGGLTVSIVSFLISLLLPDHLKQKIAD